MMLHTQLSHAQPLQPGVPWGWHIWPQVPQSWLQFEQVSPRVGSHTPSPQVQGQSCGQVAQLSPQICSHCPLPQRAQLPQSLGQVAQVSP